MHSSAFELGDAAAASKSLLLERLELVLRERRSRGGVLVVDEAQSLSLELLEEVACWPTSKRPPKNCFPWCSQASRSSERGSRITNCDAPATDHPPVRAVLRLAETATYISTRITTAEGRAVASLQPGSRHAHSRAVSRHSPRSASSATTRSSAPWRWAVRAWTERSLEKCADLGLKGGPRHGLNRPPLARVDDPAAAATASEHHETDLDQVSEDASTRASAAQTFPFRFGAAPPL